MPVTPDFAAFPRSKTAKAAAMGHSRFVSPLGTDATPTAVANASSDALGFNVGRNVSGLTAVSAASPANTTPPATFRRGFYTISGAAITTMAALAAAVSATSVTFLSVYVQASATGVVLTQPAGQTGTFTAGTNVTIGVQGNTASPVTGLTITTAAGDVVVLEYEAV